MKIKKILKLKMLINKSRLKVIIKYFLFWEIEII